MMTRKQHVDYWLKSASESMKDMRGAIKSKRRANAMFCGHLAIEKMLKGLCAVRNIEVWRDHKLLKFADRAGLTKSLSDEQLKELATITSFNIEARYDSIKLRFHNRCTLQYTALWAKKVTEWHKYLKGIILAERALLPNNTPDSQDLVLQ
jgi:HEPN domain-containing protein